MVSPLMKNATASVSELMAGARDCLKTDPAATAMLQMTAVYKALAEVAPDEEPAAAAGRLSEKWERPAIEGGYLALLWYYEDSLDPGKFSIHKEIDREDHFGIAEDVIRMLRNGNA